MATACRVAFTLSSGVTVAVAGCALVVGIPDVTLTGDGGGPDSPVPEEDAPDSAGGRGCGVAADGAPRAGPDMVRIDAPGGSYCIDTTEVTVAQFNAFLLDAGVFIDTPPECDGAAPLPLVDQIPADQDLPVGTLGSCHAWSYCRWAGKRLCGAIGDGGPTASWPQRPQDTEWVYACINGVNNYAYPYGEEHDAHACNTDAPDGGRLPVKARPACHGVVPPFDQVYDMVGNLWEFVDDLPGSGGNIVAHGGSWSTTGDAMAEFSGGCRFGISFQGAGGSKLAESGFRCCADP
jgi:formylglycine-generating enzyme required for sulfatase activity